ncbi:MAG: TlpA disulfide reductase family protein [Alcaligenaceae bacterium]
MKTVRRYLLLMLSSLTLGLFAMPSACAIELGQTLELGSVKKLDGTLFTLAKDNDKHTLIQIWASWCPFCKRQNAYLQNFVQRVPASALNILTISIDKTPEIAQKYMTDNQYSFAAAMMTPTLQSALGRMRGIPILLVLDAQNKVIRKEIGEIFEEDFADLILYAK